MAVSYTLEHKYQKLPPALLSTLSSARVQCWAEYEEQVHATECLEKDCKIDWLAIQKIECYLDVLLHDVSKKEFLTKCDSETCMNVACEGDYKQALCKRVDHEGEHKRDGKSGCLSGPQLRSREVCQCCRQRTQGWHLR